MMVLDTYLSSKEFLHYFVCALGRIFISGLMNVAIFFSVSATLSNVLQVHKKFLTICGYVVQAGVFSTEPNLILVLCLDSNRVCNAEEENFFIKKGLR